MAAPGGQLGDRVWYVSGSPRFQPGGFYLLFLVARPTGDWVPVAMAYGVLQRIVGRDGSRLLTPIQETAAVGDLVRARFGLHSLEFRVVECHACPLRNVPVPHEARDSVPHAIF